MTFYYTWFADVKVDADCMRCLVTKEVKIRKVSNTFVAMETELCI